MRSKVCALALVFLSTPLLIANGWAASDCDSVLTKEIQISSASNSSRDQAAFSYFCSHDYSEFNSTYGGKAGAQFGVFSGSVEYNQGNYNKTQHDLCTTKSSSDHQEA